MLCSVAVSVAVLPTVPVAEEKIRHGKKWPYTLRFPPGRLARRELHRRSTYCCCGTAAMLLDCIALHLRSMRRLDVSLLPYHLWPAGWGVRIRWTGTTWPASISWPSGLAGATQKGGLACFARQTRTDFLLYGRDGPSNITTRLSLFGCTASAVVTQVHTFTHSIFHALASRGQVMLGHCSQHSLRL